jgi:hypothetical protein
MNFQLTIHDPLLNILGQTTGSAGIWIDIISDLGIARQNGRKTYEIQFERAPR